MRKLSEEKLAAERERLELMKSYERQYEDSVLVCGIDEAGARNCFWRSRRRR